MKNENLAVYKLNFDCGRMGNLEGLFVADKSHVKKLIDEKLEVYFGEALGKHSEVYGPIEEGDIQLISDNTEVVNIVVDFKLESGHNPFDYTALNTVDDDLTVREIIEKRLNDLSNGNSIK